MQAEPLITLEASEEELPAIDAAVRGYIQFLRFVLDPSHDRDEVIAQLRSFQHKYEEHLMAWRARQHALAQPDTPETEKLITWQATTFELMAFGTAVIGYLHMLETTHASNEAREQMLGPLLAFEQRYLNHQKSHALNP